MDRQTAIRRVRQYLFSQDWKIQRRYKGRFDVVAESKGRILSVEIKTAPDKRIRRLRQFTVLALVSTDSIMWQLYGETDFADTITEALNVRKR